MTPPHPPIPLLLRLLPVALSLLLAFGLTRWKVSTRAGTFEAHLMARAAILANHPEFRPNPPSHSSTSQPSRAPDIFPELSPHGPDLAQVWDQQGLTTYRSPGLPNADLPQIPPPTPPNRGFLHSVSLPNGHSGYAVTVRSLTPQGHTLTATYLSANSPFLREWILTGTLSLLVMVLPTSLWALLLSTRCSPPAYTDMTCDTPTPPSHALVSSTSPPSSSFSLPHPPSPGTTTGT